MVARDALEADSLRAFDAFARHLNFTRAAEELHLSQPSLHVKIRKLSKALGEPLYERHGRRLELTRQGRALARFARDAQRGARDFLAELKGGSEGPVTLAAGRGAYLYVLGDGIRRHLDAGGELELMIADRAVTVDKVRTGLCDLGVAVFDETPRDLVSVEIARFPQTLVLTAEHPLAARDEITLTDLDGEALILPPPGRPHREATARALRSVGARWSVAVEAEGWDLLVHLAALGLGVTVVNGCVRVPEGVRQVPIRDLPSVEYRALYRSQRAARIQPFLDQLSP